MHAAALEAIEHSVEHKAHATPYVTTIHTSTQTAEDSAVVVTPLAPLWEIDMPADTAGQPCHDHTMFAANISEWAVPPGCYADIYSPNLANYAAEPGFGYCNWWPEVLHPNDPNLLDGGQYRRGTVPVPGAVVYEAPDVQGASPDGHFAQVVAVAPGGYWMLITEMNFGWRGGGFGSVDYRYIHIGPGISFIYP
jgi:hypothetical protein